MPYFQKKLIAGVGSVQHALAHEPAIRPDFADADLATIVRVIYALMLKGVTEPSAIYRYLNSRGCLFDRAAIDFLLNAYEGTDRSRHLWTRQVLGEYVPIPDDVWESEFFDDGFPD